MHKTAIVCVTNDLTTDQRVNKTCLTLQECDYEVTEVGRLLPNSLALERPYKTRRTKLWFNRGPLFYAEYNIRLFFFLLFAKVDLIYANDLDTLLAAYLAAKIRRKRIIYDTHEYYLEMPELVNRPNIQNFWRKIETFLFPKQTEIITVNDSIANLYYNQYHKNLVVVRNIPPTFIPNSVKSREELGLPADKKIIILQGAGINIDRGSEEACLAMQYIDNAILLIVGGGDVLPILKNIVAENRLEKKVIFKDKMPFADLRQHTMNADLGLTIDKDTNLNYRYSLPNKLFDYIHSNIPILSSNLVELANIINHYDIGYFIENHDPKNIAAKINAIFADEKRYAIVKGNTAKAKEELCWENEKKKLIGVINADKN